MTTLMVIKNKCTYKPPCSLRGTIMKVVNTLYKHLASMPNFPTNITIIYSKTLASSSLLHSIQFVPILSKLKLWFPIVVYHKETERFLGGVVEQFLKPLR